MSRRALPALSRDVVCLLLGAAWGSYTVYTQGPWPLMAISAATMLGPGFLRLWLSGPGTALSPPSPRPEQPEQPRYSLPGPAPTDSEAAS